MDDIFAGLDDFDDSVIQEETEIDPEEEERARLELQQLLKRGVDDDTETTEPPNKKLQLEVEDTCFNEDMERITVHNIDTVESCTHDVAVPPNQDYVPLDPPNEEPSKTYPFVLDPFQKEAILCIDNNQSVLVSAHTSAGKTVVAEYAVAMCLKNKQRVIYTTPIKALSNQKYRDFNEEFSDVGLLTGDATINPNASCLIMTTEILRSMLYRGSEITREVGWVIFDEIHYMRDKERGYVWEETIILLPPTVRFVFLSATIPNADMFAQWICYLHRQPCHVVYTEYRPVPLQHYMFPSGGDGAYLVVNEENQFVEKNFDKAMMSMPTGTEKVKQFSNKSSGKNFGGDECFQLVKMIMERDFAPAVIFSFSKRECEFHATNVAKLDFNLPIEKGMVEEIFSNAIDVLSDEDKQLPQVQNVLPLLKRGIGIHHGGLLPIIKETIEILFGEGLIKVLFATETFAMGLNMPARTVMFTSIQKFDGKDFRYLTSGEYIQMSGRAGRRGKDTKGIVIMKVDETFNKETTKKLFEGKADPINSAFHLTYNMVLNLLRVEGINPEFILERSFFQFQNYASLPQQYKEIKKLSTALLEIQIDKEKKVKSYYDSSQQLMDLHKQKQAIVTQPSHLVKFLQVGRLVRVKNSEDDYGWGVVLSYKKEVKDDLPCLIVDVILEVAKSSNSNMKAIDLKPVGDEESEPVVVPIMWKLIWDVSSVRLKLPSDLKPLSQRVLVMKMVKEALKKVPIDVLILDPIKHMKITDERLVDIIEKIEICDQKLQSHSLNSNPQKKELISQYISKIQKQKELDELKSEYENTKGALQLTELKYRKRVLRRLGYTTQQGVIDKKGRVACEFSAADELLLTEMIFEGLFTNLSAAETCAILSVFVCDERTGEIPKMGDKLSGVLLEMQQIAKKIANVCRECRLDIDEDQYVQQFKPYLIDVVYSWCNGMSFIEVCGKTTLFEGSIIRAMRRLEELLRQMIQASRAIGIELENKFSEGIKLLKRDIVFAPSLYL